MARTGAGRFSVLGLPPILAVAHERGLDEEPLLRRAGIARALLADANAELPAAQVHALVHALIDETGDPALGLEAARHIHPESFGLLGAVALVTPTMREVIELFIRYSHLMLSFFAHELDESAGVSRLVFADGGNGDLGAARRFYLDRELAFIAGSARTFWRDSHRQVVRRYELDYPEPPEAARYRAFFPCEVRFGAATAAVTFDFAYDRPRIEVNALGVDVLKDHLSSFGAPGERADDVVERIRQEIAVAVTAHHALPAADTVAATLGMSERALRRKLAARGTSFRALTEEVIAPLAKRYLRESALSVADIADRVGYSEAASFVRAFRRWTGTTPEAFRKRGVALMK